MNLNELVVLLKTSVNVEEIDRYQSEIEDLIPLVCTMVGYDQKNSAHQYDLWMHSLHTVINLPRNMEDNMVYLAALLHDIGKPDSACSSNRPNDFNVHYYGHPQKSLEIVRDVIIPELENKGFVISSIDVKRLLYYIEYHDDRVSVKLKHINRHMKLTGYEEFKYLMILQTADAKAHVQIPIIAQRVEICSALAAEEGEKLYQIYLKEGEKI